MSATAPGTPPRKKGMNGIVIGCLAAVVIAILLLVGFVVAMISLLMAATAAPVAAADAFFHTAATQGAAAAYAQTAPSYQSTIPQASFEGLAARSKFTEVDHESWNSRSVNNDTATLSGQLHYKSGGGDPVTVTLQKSGDAWKIVAIEGPAVATP